MLEFLQELLIELACDYASIDREEVIKVEFFPDCRMVLTYNVVDGWDGRWVGTDAIAIHPYDLLGGNRL